LPDVACVNAVKRAGQGFCYGCGYKGCAGGESIEVLPDDTFGNEEILSVSAVEEEEIFA
jgi:hypothetical protein